VQKRAGECHKKPYITRWKVDGKAFSRSYRTKGEADRVRTALLLAVQSGEAFDQSTGEPMSWQPLPEQMQMHVWARQWLAEQWLEWAPRTRVSAVEALTRLLPLLVVSATAPPPATMRSHLAASLGPDHPVVDQEAEAWLAQWCIQLGQLTRPILAVVDQRLVLRIDGEPLAPATAGRFR
jgi:hypothetical protein